MTGILPQQKNILTGFVRSGCFFQSNVWFQEQVQELIPHGGGFCPHTPDRAVAISRM